MKHKLSNQAVGALMMALQKCLLEQSDITEILKDFDFIVADEGLVVENPPSFHVQETVSNELA